jgi:hypothetical protein
MTTLRTSLTIGLAALFVATTIGYSFFQPFKEQAVITAMPRMASSVYKVDSLQELLESPICSQIDKALGANLSLKALTIDNDWLSLAAPSEIAVTDLQIRNSGARNAWAAASWVGWRSPWLRWKLEANEGDDLKFIGKHAVWPIWEYSSSELPANMRLMISLTDNLFILCLSENPTDITLLLDTYDGRVPSAVYKERG